MTTTEPGGGPQQLLPDQASIDNLGGERPTDSDITSQEPSSDQNKIQWSGLGDDEKKRIRDDVLCAIEKGNLDKVKGLVAKYDGLRLEYWEYAKNHGDNPLHLAAFYGHLQIVKYFIEERDFHRECHNSYKNTPLHRAARQGQLAVVQYLVEEKQCDPMCQCNWGRTPLHNACKYDQIDVVKYLMRVKNVIFSFKDKRHRRPLDLAAENGSIKVVKYMTGENKCYNPLDYKGSDTPLHYAASNGKKHVVKHLIANKMIDCNVKGYRNRTALHSACKGGHKDVVEYLLKVARADAYCQDLEDGLTPLDLAAEHASLDLVKYMIDEGYWKAPFPNENKHTALHYAAYGGKLKSVKFLIEGKYLKPDCRGWKGKTPLHSACRGGRNNVVEYLIHKCGVSLSEYDNGNTPLHSAVKSGDKKSVVVLLIADTECDVVNYEGRDPISIAKEMEYNEIAEYLEKAKELHAHQHRNTLKKRLQVTKAISPGEVIAEGTFSEFTILTDGEKVAGKVTKINPSDTQHLMKRFEAITEDINTILGLSHDNIAQSKGVCFLPDKLLPILLMERMTTSLQSHLLHRKVPIEEAIGILRDIAGGLMYLHNLNPPFIHGHLTTETVLVQEGHKAKIGDFAIKSVCQLPYNTKYMPPDAQDGIPPSNPSHDIFSFGHLGLVTVIQEKTGSLDSFQFINEAGELNIQHEVKRRDIYIKRAEELLGSKSEILFIIKKCLQNDPDQRPCIKEIMAKIEITTSEPDTCSDTGQRETLEECVKEPAVDDGEISSDTLLEKARPRTGCEAEGSFDQCFPPKGKHILKLINQSDDRFPGIEFFGKPLKVTATTGGIQLNWKEYGIEFEIPSGAIPNGKRLDLKVWPCTSQAFNLPEGSQLASPVFLIEPSFTFSCDVKIKMHHFFDLTTNEDCKSMTFLSAPTSLQRIDQMQLQYHFSVLEKGFFMKAVKYGTISLKHFCFLGCANFFRGLLSPPKKYAFQVYQNHSKTTVVFIATLNHSMYMTKATECVTEKYPHMNPQPSQPITITGETLALDWPKNTDWNIVPAHSCSISRQILDSPENLLNPPMIVLTVHQHPPSDASINVNLIGVTKETAFVIQTPLSSCHAGGSEEGILSSKPRMSQLQSLQTPTGGEKIEIIKTVAQKWKTLGDCLDFDTNGTTLDNIEADEGHKGIQSCCRAMFQHWLNGNGTKPTTWKTLLKLLKDHGFKRLASQVQSALIPNVGGLQPSS